MYLQKLFIVNRMLGNHQNEVLADVKQPTNTPRTVSWHVVSGGARVGLDGAIAPPETCLAPTQPPQGFPNYFPVFLALDVTLINIEK